MKYAWIDEHRRTYGLTESGAVLNLKRGGTPDRRWLMDANEKAVIDQFSSLRHTPLMRSKPPSFQSVAMPELTNQVAVVSGASSGIGKAVALGLLQAGANVYLVGRCLKRLQAVAVDYPNLCQRMVLYPTDLSIDADIHTLAATVKRNHGNIDIVIHSAGVITLGRMEQASINDFDYQYAINVRAAYLLTQALLPALKRECGQIVYINSSVGIAARAGVGQYAATKHALKAIADSLREEVNADGIRVLSVYPGRTASPMQQALHEVEGKCYQPEDLVQPEDVASVVIHALTLPRTAEVTDIHIRPLKKAGFKSEVPHGFDASEAAS